MFPVIGILERKLLHKPAENLWRGVSNSDGDWNTSKAGHRSTLAFLRFYIIAATGIRKHTQVELLWITRRIRRISAFPSKSERLDASVFTSTLPATKLTLFSNVSIVHEDVATHRSK